MQRLAPYIAALLLAGCAPVAVRMYDGPERLPSEHSSISAVGLYPDKKISLQIIKIDGKAVNVTNAAAFQLLPGEYLFTIHAKNDLKVSPSYGVGLSWKEATLDIRLQTRAGHTYIPNGVVSGDKIRVYFDDKGVNYKKSCIHLYRFAIAYGGRADGGNDPDC